MAAIDDLVAQVSDSALRKRIQTELRRASKQKKFGLVFEEHLPECTPLYDVPLTPGRLAARQGNLQDLYYIEEINGETAHCIQRTTREAADIPVEELVTVAEFGDPIYPYLAPIDTVENAPGSDLWHTLIEADNYHALQLLGYLYAGKVDCIYIDPPYNTGAKDWKYNNDYVDGNDQYRHSKWISFMEKRLKLAKKLLNSKDSVLIVTIDEKEYLHLGCLLEELFPEARIQMVSTMINPANVARAGEFGRSGEYIFFVMLGKASPQRVKVSREWVSSKGRTHTGNVRWDLLKRSGTNSERRHSPGGFYPVYINNHTGKIEDIGDPLPAGISKAPHKDGCTTLLPIRRNGTEGNWQWSKKTFETRMAQGRVHIGGNAKKGFTIYILKDGEYSKIVNGEFEVSGRGVNGELVCDSKDSNYVMAVPGDIWKIASHDSTQYGSRMIGDFFSDRRFTFPKSLYAVKDALRFFSEYKRDALIVDFFAGSGTTLHAVNLLNAKDGGHRRCIMVTNNEVSEAEAKALAIEGYKPGDDEWEKLGIARYVTWPRIVCSIKGININGDPLKGSYGTFHEAYVPDEKKGCYKKVKIADDEKLAKMDMSDGFAANAAFFRLGFLDKHSVARGEQLEKLLPVLWMKAGAIGAAPKATEEHRFYLFPRNRFAVLIDPKYTYEFTQALYDGGFDVAFIITDYEAEYRSIADGLNVKQTYQLYRDYLENFTINTGRN